MNETKTPKRREILDTMARETGVEEEMRLVGRYFHTTHELGWQGRVVSEPRPGWYLIETYDWFVGHAWSERLTPIHHMAGWYFYDSAEEMRYAYEHSVAREWERAREPQDA